MSHSIGFNSGYPVQIQSHNASFPTNPRFPSYVGSAGQRLELFRNQVPTQSGSVRTTSGAHPNINYNVLNSTIHHQRSSVTATNRHPSGIRQQSAVQHPFGNNSTNFSNLRGNAPATLTHRLDLPKSAPTLSHTGTTNPTMPLFVSTGSSSTVNTADLSTSSSFADLVRASTENISPPIDNTSIAGCPNDVQPIVIAPVDYMPPTPAAQGSMSLSDEQSLTESSLIGPDGKVASPSSVSQSYIYAICLFLGT